MKILIILFMLLLSPISQASLDDCQGVYVGRIWVERGVGLKAVVYLGHPDNTSGSYWSYFHDWTDSEKQSVLSILLSAKAMKHPVNVTTDKPNGCSVTTGGTVTTAVYMATNP
ncbi:hypothetical protein [Pseudoalteromonas rubra]|uniref:hypothetical protein n=1 Tax=Pseudoalteromonas rubra TaxID=43658 RepID=UPI000F76FB48|nr:hypothetical protein [Pseudoalteromonas rubra]